MRPLHILLPIARQFLISAEQPTNECYVCYAANRAADRGDMTRDEADVLGKTIVDELGPGMVFLRTHLLRSGLLQPDVYVDDPAYFPVRDKWLDELQAKWEGAGC